MAVLMFSKKSFLRDTPISSPNDCQAQKKRENLKQLVNKLYPGIHTRNDFDILHLSSGAYNKENNGNVHDWLDKEYSYLAREYSHVVQKNLTKRSGKQ